MEFPPFQWYQWTSSCALNQLSPDSRMCAIWGSSATPWLPPHCHICISRVLLTTVSGSISISPELFEKIYLSPQNKVAGDLRKTFGNPTPVALCGFLLSLTPLSCDLMGWRGAGGNGAASTGVYFFFGGLLMIFGALGEVRHDLELGRTQRC